MALKIGELACQRRARETAAAEADRLITAEDIEHRRAVIQRAARPIDHLCLRPIAADHHKEIAARLLDQILMGGVVHRQMIRGHHDHGVFKVRGRLDAGDQPRHMLLRTGHRAERLVGLALVAVAFALAAARHEAVGMVRIHGQREQGEAFLLARQRLILLEHLIHHRIIVVAPVVTVGGIGDAIFQLL